MRKFLAFIAIGMLAVSPTLASTPETTSVSLDSIEELYRHAERICPIAAEKNDGYLVDRFVKRMRFTDLQGVLMMKFCLVYLKGRSDELDLRIKEAL